MWLGSHEDLEDPPRLPLKGEGVHTATLGIGRLHNPLQDV